ncbi:MAG: hypothetical protein WAL94_02690 [Bacteroidales bacterium]
MENEEKLMTGEESLKVITAMINKTRVSVTQSSFHLLFWGWLIFACSLSEFLLWKFTDFASPWYVWFFVIPGVFVSMIYGFTKGRKASLHTYAEGIYVWVWMAFFIASVVLFIVHSNQMESVSKYILLVAAMPTFISGIVLKFKPLIWGGVSMWVLALAAHFGGDTISGLAVPVAMITGYLIPGYLLRKKGSHETL